MAGGRTARDGGARAVGSDPIALTLTVIPTLTVTLTRYEGGGLYRHVHLVRASPVHVEQDGLFAYSYLAWGSGCGDGRVGGGGGDGCAGPLSATVRASATLLNAGPADATAPRAAAPHDSAAAGGGEESPEQAAEQGAATVCVTFTLTGPDGAVAATASAPTLSVGGGATATADAILYLASPLLWSAPSPTLYTLTATVRQGACAEAFAAAAARPPAPPAAAAAAAVIDETSVSHGFRELHFDADAGFYLNRQHFKVRGFCDHNSFAIVGMAVPERVNLFRAQASRAVGGNGRRTSHNPPDPAMLRIYDRLGVVVVDENRLFDNNPAYVANMGAIVKRDRNHASVILWSFCNEVGCEGRPENARQPNEPGLAEVDEAGGPAFYDVPYAPLSHMQ